METSDTRLKALLFDVDGTLAETERHGHLPAYNLAFAELGIPWRWDAGLYGQLLAVTGSRERMRHYARQWRQPLPAVADEDALLRDLHRRKNAHYAAIVASGALPLRPGVRRLIGEARAAGLRLAIVTTTSPENVSALLRHCLAPDAEQWFEVIAAGDIVPHKKPAPDIYHYALERLGLAAGDCMALEDSENGVRACAAAGVPVLVTVGEYCTDHDFSGAAAVLDALGGPDQPPVRVLAGDWRAPWVSVPALQAWFSGLR